MFQQGEVCVKTLSPIDLTPVSWGGWNSRNNCLATVGCNVKYGTSKSIIKSISTVLAWIVLNPLVSPWMTTMLTCGIHYQAGHVHLFCQI